MLLKRVRLTFTEEVLGSMPNNPDIYREFIASKGPDAKSVEDEVARLGADEVAVKGTTVFPKLEDGAPYIYDYQVKGFFKDACSSLRRAGGSKSSKLKAHKKVIDGTVFIQERRIPYELPEGGEVGKCARPLRAETAQGPRVALAESEAVPAGSAIEFTIALLTDELWPTVSEWLDYGQLRGIGQWRNSGKGRFHWKLVGEKQLRQLG